MFQIISLLSHQFSMEDQVFFFRHTLEANPRFYLRCLPVCHLKFLYDLRYCYATHVNIKINSPIGHLFAYNFFFLKEPPKSSKMKIHHIVFEFGELMLHNLNAPHLLCFSKKKKILALSYVQEALCHMQYYWRLWILV